MTEAETWDRRIERAEWLFTSSFQELEHLLDQDQTMEFLHNTCDAAENSAIEKKWDINDKILTFSDGSKLLLIAPGANTAAGYSRVIHPSDTTQGRSLIRGSQPYRHGVTHYAWLTFPPHDSF